MSRSFYYPIRIITDVTRKCNLTCYYCHSASGSNYNGPELSSELFLGVLKAAETLKVFEVTITGGEPLLWEALNNIERTIDNTFSAVQIITNATLVDSESIEKLYKLRPDRICISIDGPSFINDNTRGKGHFKDALAAIPLLRKVVDNVTVISVLDRMNADKWPELTYELLRYGVRQHHLSPVCYSGAAKNIFSQRALRREDFDNIRSRVHEMHSTLPHSFRLRFNDALINPSLERSFSLNTFTEIHKGHHVIVRPDGSVWWAIRAWGRDWMKNEQIGHLEEDMYKIIAERGEFKYRAFERYEELARKFHLGTLPFLAQMDLDDITHMTDSTSTERVDSGGLQSWSDEKNIEKLTHISPSAELNNIIQSCGKEHEVSRFRLKAYANYGLLFDRVSFEVHVLTRGELSFLRSLGVQE